MMKTKLWLLATVLTAALLSSCEDAAKAGADAAIKAGESALNSVKADAEKYIPGDTKAVSEALANAKASFEKQDYAGALTAAKDLASKATALGPAAMKAKEELTKGWSDIGASVPNMMKQVQGRVDALNKAKKLPADAGEKFAAAKTNWDQAAAAFKSGNLAEAMSKATAARDNLTTVASAVGVKLADAAKK